ncbi:MAG: type I polyketide synthase [Scytonema sp. PMC 1069.18]|nr:type I polyketide synthase [Scytonema sp. PMC 1069.18]MEC4882103.1 type I polyketide synthase [Scytonema sp. PMC 1070.18]
METNHSAANQAIAIVGMDACWSSFVGLDAFERCIYDGKQDIIAIPSQNSLEEHNKKEENSLQKILLRVTDNALNNAGVKPGENVAVIIASTIEVASQEIQRKWSFTSTALTITAGENSVYQALNLAKTMLLTGEAKTAIVAASAVAPEVEDILLCQQAAQINTGTNTLSYDKKVNGFMLGEGAGAVVLKRLETAKGSKNNIYAVIEAISLVEKNDILDELYSAEVVTQACLQAFSTAKVKPEDIEYLEVFGSGIPQQDEAEILGLIKAYQTLKPDLSCAIGSIKANIGHTYTASGIASLIKTALCLHYRYIPATPQWTGVKNSEVWTNSPFYVPTESTPWFLAKRAQKRVAAINGVGQDRTYVHIILAEEPSQKERSSKYLEQVPFYLFPVAASNQFNLLEQLAVLQSTISDSLSLAKTAHQTFVDFQKSEQTNYAIAILGRNKDELIREIQRGLKGVKNAFDKGKDWQSPTGSYFTTNPLGKKGKIAFVYPGAFNSYIGLGQNIFRLFPKIWDSRVSHVPNIGEVFRQKLLYPRSLNALTRRQLEKIEQKLLDNALAMLETGIGFATYFTEIMKEYFQLKPYCTFGYSLGEISMMCAQGVWSDLAEASRALNSSSLFVSRLSGSKNAVREYWGLPQAQNAESESFWSNYVLINSASQVIEYLRNENRVYLTHINTPKEVVIGGDTQACLKLIETLKCDAFRAPSDDILHCEAMRSEYDELVKLNSFPTRHVPNTIFYSAAEYKPIHLDSNSISRNIAQGLCQPLDFPRLIHQVYEDGGRIFVEAGAGSTCSRWISENLKDKEHLTVALNKRGVDDHTSIVRALAKLLSHQVSLDLSPLYSSPETSQDITNTDNNQSLVDNSLLSPPAVQQHTSTMNNNGTSFANYTNRNHMTSNIIYDPQQNIAEKQQLVFEEKAVTPPVLDEKNLSILNHIHFQKLSTNSSALTKIHTKFLHDRQDSGKQLREIIQLQIALVERAINEDS